MNTTILKSLSTAIEQAVQAIQNLNMQEIISDNDTQLSKNQSINYISSNIIIDTKMLQDIESMHYGYGIVDNTKMIKISQQLCIFEEKHGMPAGLYIISRYTDINNFELDSVTINNGVYNFTKQVIAHVDGNTLTINAIVSSTTQI